MQRPLVLAPTLLYITSHAPAFVVCPLSYVGPSSFENVLSAYPYGFSRTPEGRRQSWHTIQSAAGRSRVVSNPSKSVARQRSFA